MKILDLEQGTLAWHEARRCVITGTKLGMVMGSSLDQIMLISELIAEEGTEQSKQVKMTSEMERGTAEEVFAIKFFEEKTGKKVERVGFCLSEEYDFLGLSPDGFVKNKGKYTEAVEVKSPDAKNSVFYKLEDLVGAKELGLTPAKSPFLGIPIQYKWQAINYFLVNPDLKTLHFVIYDARFISDDAKMHIIEIKAENEILQDEIKKAKEALLDFRTKWLKYKSMILPDNF